MNKFMGIVHGDMGMFSWIHNQDDNLGVTESRISRLCAIYGHFDIV
jgi:hypothetical protein